VALAFHFCLYRPLPKLPKAHPRTPTLRRTPSERSASSRTIRVEDEYARLCHPASPQPALTLCSTTVRGEHHPHFRPVG